MGLENIVAIVVLDVRMIFEGEVSALLITTPENLKIYKLLCIVPNPPRDYDILDEPLGTTLFNRIE